MAGDADFPEANSCLKDCLPLPIGEHEVSLLGTPVYISFEQEHFAPIDVC